MLEAYAERYRRALLDSAAFWMRHSLDREHGGCFTCLDREGHIYDPRKYVWMQGRAVWMFSRLYNEFERRSEWLDAAGSILSFVRRHGKDTQGRYYFSLTRDGQPAFYQRKPYSAVFVVLGLVEYYRATGEQGCLDEAIELFGKVQQWIDSPALLGRPVYGAPASQLADIMVLASMALELTEVHTDPLYDQVMRGCVDAAMRHYDPSRRIFMEILAPRDFPEGRLFCPGSSIEVAWFLLHVLRRRPDSDVQKALLDVIEGSLEFGWDREYGGLYYFMDVDGRPPQQLEAPMKLWWPHTEAIYAVVLACELTGEKRWLNSLAKVDQYAFARFADPEHGEWFGYCDRHGNLTTTLKGGSYKGFFHVPRFLLFSLQSIQRLSS